MARIVDEIDAPDKTVRHRENYHIVVKFPDRLVISFEVSCFFSLRKLRLWCTSLGLLLPDCLKPYHFNVDYTEYLGYEVKSSEDFQRIAYREILSALRYPYLYNLYFINHEKSFRREITKG